MFHLFDHNKFMYYFRNKELDELYASVFLSSLAGSLISIFVPVYLLQLQYSLKEIFLFYLVHYAVIFVFFPFAYRMSKHLGVKKFMVLGTVCAIVYYLLLNKISLGVHYFVPAIVSGFYVVLYFTGFNISLARAADNNKEGKELSLLQALTMTAVTVGPLLGAFFIIRESFSTTFFIVTVLQVISLIPLFLTHDHVTKYPFRLRRALSTQTFRSAAAYVTEGVGALAGAVFWPLFIYLAVEDVVSLGGIITLTSVLMIFFVLAIGHLIDKHAETMLRWGVWTHAPIWISRLFFLSPAGLFVNNVLSNISGHLLILPFRKILYHRASRNPINVLFFREFYLSIGRFLLIGMALFTMNFTWIFFAAFITTFCYLLPLKKA